MAAEFRPPAIYEFPPFFTKQVNEQTWAAQLRHWQAVVLAYCRATNTWRLPTDSPLFANPRIQRSLRPDTVAEVLDYIVTAGSAEWLPGHAAVLVYVQTAAQLAQTIRQWAEETGHAGTVLTLYELGEGELAGLESLAGADSEMLTRAASQLVKNGHAAPLKEDGLIKGIKLA